MSSQHPVELILARGLMSNLITPAFLVDAEGTLVFFNESAGELLGLRYDVASQMDRDEWSTRFDPIGQDGRRLDPDELPLAVALRELRPAHLRFSMRSLLGAPRDIEVSAFPIVGNTGIQGAMAIFWDAAP